MGENGGFVCLKFSFNVITDKIQSFVDAQWKTCGRNYCTDGRDSGQK
jgi:hypothetical protein